MRNDVVVPHLAQVLAAAPHRTVLDLGSGTGYITRALAHQPWATEIDWVLVDFDEQLLQIARNSMLPQWSVATLRRDLTMPLLPGSSAMRADCAFAVFTLLEIPTTPILARNCAELLMPGGELLIYVPDVLVDVMAASIDDDSALARYVAGHTALNKIDHFTGAPDVFHATRVEHLLSVFLAADLRLAAFDIIGRTDRAENIHCLRFERVEPASTG